MPVYTVGQITRYVRESLEKDLLLADLWVTGEVSNLRTYNSGHTYFTLKDSHGQLRSVMFKGGRGAELLVEGGQVTGHGRISFYETRGDVQLQADLIMPEGTGPLHLQLEKLKLQLEEEGLFETSRKRLLPEFPKVIGVVTSPSGAVFHDICNVVGRRYPLVEILLAPTSVQGDGAAHRIGAAIRALNQDRRSEVIILARGGGTLEELWPFNEEKVARAIYASRVPVVSAVGHETDTTIADLVADLRAPTPSAAAELVVPDKWALSRRVSGLRTDLDQALTSWVAGRREAARSMVRRLCYCGPDFATWRRRVDDRARAAYLSMRHVLTNHSYQVDGYKNRLKSLDPRAVLDRGYAIVEARHDGQVVRQTDQVFLGEQLKITVTDGDIPATVGNTVRRNRTKQAPAPAGARLL